MVRLSVGPKSITENVNIEEWARQADIYESIRNDGAWNKTLQTIAIINQDHPFAAVRVREILKWCDTVQYKNIIRKLSESKEVDSVCLSCHHNVEPQWKFCLNCGSKL